MNNFARIILPIAAFLVFTLKLAHAAEMKVFHPGGPDQCKLSKAVGGKWVPTEDAYDGHPVEISPVGKSTKFSQFKSGPHYYAAKTACFKNPGEEAAEFAGVAPAGSSRFFVELKGRKYLMVGSGMGGTTENNDFGTATSGPYTSGFGFGGRVGYFLNEKNALFLDVSTLSGKQSAVYSGTVTGPANVEESLLSINVGYLEQFGQGALRPFASVSLGYTSMSGTFTSTLSAPLNNMSFKYSSSNINVSFELGAAYALSPMFDLVGSIDYTMLSLSKFKVDSSGTAGLAGQELPNNMGYSHLGLGLGLRASF